MRIINKKTLNIFFAMLIIFFANVNIVHGTEEDKIKVSYTYGFESVYKYGSIVPITVEIDNSLKNIDGELQIEVPEYNPNMGAINNNNISIYTQSINLPLNTRKKFTINVPISRNMSSLKINVVENKNLLFTKDLSIGGTPLNPSDFIIGTFSDDFNSVSYINRVATDSNASVKRIFNTKLVKLDENTLPEDINVLKPINIIFLNNFDTSKLSKAKYEALKKWVEQGGMLLIGTGSSYSKTLSIFKDNFLSGDIGTVSSIQTSSLYKLSENNNTNSMKLDILNIIIKDGEAIVKEGNTPLVYRIERGKGTIALAAFDFGLSPLTDWKGNSSFGEALLSKALPSYYGDPSYDMMINGGSANNISYALGNIPELPVPKSSSLIIIFFIYILLVAPVNYFILKKKDRRELMWLTVPILSIIFAAIVYFAGSATRITKPFVNILSTIEIDSKGNQTVQCFGTVVTPSKSDIKVEAEDGINIRPLLNLQYYEGKISPNGTSQNKDNKNIYSKVEQTPKTILEFYKTGVFSQYNFVIDSAEQRKGALQAEVNFSDNKLTGTIKNNTGLDLNDCYIVTSNNYVNIGEIKNGQIKNVNEPIKTYTGRGYDLINSMLGTNYMGPTRNAGEIKERREKEQKRALMQSYLETKGMRVQDSLIFAISDSPITKNILVNKDTVKKYGRNLVVSKVNVSYINGNKAEYPSGSITPQVTLGQNQGINKLGYDEMNGIIHGESGSVEFKYSIDKKIKVENLEIKETQSNPNMGKFGMIEGKGYVWNINKNNWEEFDYKNFSMTGDKVSEYVDKDNVFKIKIDISGMKNPGTIPQIYVKGSVK